MASILAELEKRPLLEGLVIATGTIIAVFGGAGLFIAIVTHFAIERDGWRCVTAWKESGVQSKYIVGVGCLVEIEPDTWIPETAFWTWKVGRLR